jgi:predicted nucleic acid-binding protein
LSATAPRANPLRRYADASALVKLVLDEPESEDLAVHVGESPRLSTSRLAIVEVTRAAQIATTDRAAHEEASLLLGSCDFIEVSAAIVREAARLASGALRALDAIHLASIIRAEPDEVLAYDRRLVRAARELGFTVAHPGAEL